ncbi:MAG: DUF2461 domain-containing protein [Chloroflexota bacterium]
MSTFTGFPQDAFQFLAELEENNDKEWFGANKKRYEASVLAPTTAFIVAVGEQLQSVVPNIRYDTKTNGSGSLMRIHRDTRFSKDKTPYKTNVSAMWWEGPGKKTVSPGFGFQMNQHGMGLMAGQFAFDKNQLARYREVVNEPKHGDALNAVIGSIDSDPDYEILGEQYKKVPRGYDAEHPHGDLLKYKGLYSHPKAQLSPAQLMQADVVSVCSEQLKKMAALQQWLATHLL